MVNCEDFAHALEHWAGCFKDGTLYDAYAEDIAYLLEDKAHDVRLVSKMRQEAKKMCETAHSEETADA